MQFINSCFTFKVSETMAQSQSNGYISSCYDDAEDKPMLMGKKNNNSLNIDNNTSSGQGITALINRQLQGILHK